MPMHRQASHTSMHHQAMTNDTQAASAGGVAAWRRGSAHNLRCVPAGQTVWCALHAAAGSMQPSFEQTPPSERAAACA